MVILPFSPTASALVTTMVLAVTFYSGRWWGMKITMNRIEKDLEKDDDWKRNHICAGILKTSAKCWIWRNDKTGNAEIAALGDDVTFAELKLIENKLGLPRGTSFEMGGYSDYSAFEMDEDWIEGLIDRIFRWLRYLTQCLYASNYR